METLRVVLVALLAGLLVSPSYLLSPSNPRDDVADADTQSPRAPSLDASTDQTPSGHGAGLPVWFEQNVGQGPQDAPFVGYMASHQVLAYPDRLVLVGNGTVSFVMPKAAEVRAEDPLTSYSNYYQGADASRWQPSVAHYARLRYAEVLPGVDVVFYADERGGLEFDVLAERAMDAAAFAMRVESPFGMNLEGGDLVIPVHDGEVVLPAPTTFQEDRVVPSAFRVSGPWLSFELGPHDPLLPLRIDPKVGYSSFLGSPSTDYVSGVAPSREAVANAADHLYAVGSTYVYTGSAMPGYAAYQAGSSGSCCGTATTATYQYDIWVAKFDTATNGVPSLLWVAFLGSQYSDYGFAIDTAADGVYITGYTMDAPTGTAAVQWYPFTPNAAKTLNAESLYDNSDVVVSRLNHAGTSLIYSSAWGGQLQDFGNAIRAQGNGRVIVAGSSYFSLYYNMQTTPDAYQPEHAGTSYADVFVAQFDTNAANGPSSILYSTFVGGAGNEAAFDVDLLPNGDALITGYVYHYCSSSVTANGVTTCIGETFPTSAGAYKSLAVQYNYDGFVTVVPVATKGTNLPFSTLVGGSSSDGGAGVVALANGKYAVVGTTYSSDTVPVGGGWKPSRGATDYYDGFVLVLDPTQTGNNQVVSGTYLGPTGAAYDYFYEIAEDSVTKNIVVFGYTTQGTLWTPNKMPLAYQRGSNDFVIVRLLPDLSEDEFTLLVGTTGSDVVGDLFPSTQYPCCSGMYHPGALNARNEPIFGFTSTTGLPTPIFQAADFTGYQQTRFGGYDPYVGRLTRAEPSVVCPTSPNDAFTREQPSTLYLRSGTSPNWVESGGVDYPTNAAATKWWFVDNAGSPPTYASPPAGHASGSILNPQIAQTWTFPGTIPATTGSGTTYPLIVEVRDTGPAPKDTVVKTCNIRLINVPPVASITASAANPFVGQSVTFNALGATTSFDPDRPAGALNQGIESASWSFAGAGLDCAPGQVGMTATCSWTSGGVKTVTLAVTDRDGATSTTLLKPNVGFVPPPQAGIVVREAVVLSCSDVWYVDFLDGSMPAGSPIVSWRWDFGDGASSGEVSPTHIYTSPGEKEVRLTITDQGSPPVGPQSSTATFRITLQRAPPPLAFVDETPPVTPVGAALHFAGHGEAGPASPLSVSGWDFGEGLVLQDRVVRTATTPGTFTARYVVRDHEGCEAAITVPYTVTAPGSVAPDAAGEAMGVMAPAARFTLNPSIVRLGDVIVATDASMPGSYPLATWEYDWGDGSAVDDEANAIHRFDAVGTFHVKLLVRDAVGNKDDEVAQVVVVADGDERIIDRRIPVADAGPDRTVRTGDTVVLDASQSLSPLGSPLGYEWTQLGQDARVALAGSATREASFRAPPGEGVQGLVFQLVVSDGLRRSAPDFVTIRVVPQDAPIIVAHDLGGGAYEFSLDGADAMRWDFGDGAKASEARPVYGYAHSGSYVVRATTGTMTVEHTLEVDTTVAPRQRQEPAPQSPLEFAGMPLWAALGVFLVTALACAVAWYALANRSVSRGPNR